MFAKVVVLFLLSALLLNAQWVNRNSGVSSTLNDIAILDSITVIAVGDGCTIIKSTDRGTTWQKITVSAAFNLKSVFFITPKVGVAAGNGSSILATTNGGVSWSEINHNSSDAITSCFINGPIIVLGMENTGMLYSSNSGQTWSVRATPPGKVYSFIYDFQSSNIYACCGSAVLKSEDFGDTWKNLNVGGTMWGGYRASVLKGENRIVIVGLGGDLPSYPVLAYNQPGDSVWNFRELIWHWDTVLVDVAPVSSNVYYFLQSNGTIYRSTDTGKTLVPEHINASPKIKRIQFHDASLGYAVGESGIVFTRYETTATEDHEQAGTIRSMQLNNYPNPFNPETRIKFYLPDAQQVQLNLYNSLGQLLSVLDNGYKSSGEHELVFNGTGFPSGIYIIQLKSGTQLINRQVMLLK
ncbi:MAG: T9SS type A sorting domain-containing protein [Ignavibacteriales bacterium]|nr:T9SS type A sorting domain-containing protein [Ignavibacteriales bacterium]